ncbi:hypothetical protein ACVILH_001604 [Bradyrhizobium sp. USDA 4353]
MGAVLDALGAGNQRRTWLEQWREVHDGAAQVLRGNDDEDGIGAGGLGEIGGDGDAVGQRNAGQTRIFARGCDA